MKGISVRTRTLFVLALVAIAAVSAGSLALFRQGAAAADGVQHTLMTLVELEALLSSLQDAETGQRGFLLTGRDAYLESYRRGAAEFPMRFERVRDALAGDPAQAERLRKLESLTRDKLAELEETIRAAVQGRTSDALALVDSGRGKALMDDVRRVVEEIVDAQRRTLEGRQAGERRAGDVFLAGSLAGSAILVLLSLLTFLGARRDLRQAERMAEERTRTQDYQERAISILGHDIRAPLTASELASGRVLSALPPLESPVRRSAETVRRSTRRALRIVESLLDLTHLRLGKGLPLSPAASNAFEVASSVVDEIAPEERSRVSLETLGSGEGVFDDVRLGQALSNLVVNALRYGRPGTPIRLTVDGRDPSWLGVAVHNEGEPIRPELIPQLFDPFRRGDSKVARRESLGLGLYIVQEIVRAHGGRVDLVSSEPAGTTLTLTIPRTVARPSAGAPTSSGQIGSGSGTVARG